MLCSRLALRNGNALAIFKPTSQTIRVCSSGAGKEWKLEPLNIKEGPERDVVNFPRLKRPEFPGKVRMGFLPDEWFTFFYNKTGVTGPYVFGLTFTTYLLSKEIWVLEHEFYTGVSLGLMAVYAIKKFGPNVAKYLDKQVDDAEKSFTEGRENAVQTLKSSIVDEEVAQAQAQAMPVLFEAKRENVLLQLEAAFRARQMQAYNEVKRRLDYQVEKLNAQRRLEQKHMVEWIVSSVVKSITAQQEKEALQKCITDLKALSAKA